MSAREPCGAAVVPVLAVMDVREKPEERPLDVVLQVVLVRKGAEHTFASLSAEVAHVQHVPPD